MRKILMAAVVASLAGAASADIFNDNSGSSASGGDLHSFFADQGFNHLDIVSVSITNDASNLYVDIQLNADLDATNWGKYALAINNGVDASDAGNGWGRNVDWNGQTITHWIATWADDGGSGIGGQVWSYSGGWNLTGGLSGADDSQHAGGHQIFSVALSDLNVSVGSVILFDVISTGGGNDPGVDHLSRQDPSTSDWGTTSVAGQFLAYTIAPVPAPGAMALMGLGGLVAGRRRR